MPHIPERLWEEIDAILDRALDAPARDRDGVVVEACRGDAELEARVRELLAAALRAEAAPDLRVASRAPAVLQGALARLDEPVRLAAGSRLGAYQIVASIGAGGMGQVYLAERADGQFDRRVALKVLSAPAVDAKSRSRFQRERQILAGLHHEHIALLLDGGVTDDGRPFFVLEYVDGVPITDFSAKHRLGRDERIALLLQACEAVQHAHGQGIVHRDLKPANLLVAERSDGPPHLSVLDFGVARTAGTGDLTRTGDIIGTPAYMAPEQARGEVESVDRRADVFALGVVLYELLCDRRPFEGSTPVEILSAVLRADPTDPRALVPALPRDLENVVLTCLESRPERRYGSVRSLADDLRRYLAGEPIAARARSPARRVLRAIRRRPVFASILLAALLSGIFGGSVMLREKNLARHSAEVARRYGQVAEEIAATIRFEHLIALHDTAPARHRLSERLARLENDLESLAPSTEAAARLSLGRGYLALGQLDKALFHLDGAWTSGLRSPAAALTLAEAEVERYRRDRSVAEQISDPVLRHSRLSELAARSHDRAHELRELAGNGYEQGDLVEAQIAFLEGDRSRAAELTEAALAVAPWRYEAHMLRGEIEIAKLLDARGEGEMEQVLEYLEQARSAFRDATEVAPSDSAPHARLCGLAAQEVEIHLHDLQGAVEEAAFAGADECAKAQAADGSSVLALVTESVLRTLYARDLSRRGENPFDEIDRAIAAADRAVELEPDHASAHRRLGDAWGFRAEFERERGQDSSASIAAGLKPLEEAVRLAPGDAGVWNSLGLLRWEELLLLYAHGEDFRDPTRAAIDAFGKAVAIEPEYSYAWSNLGTMYNKLAEAAIFFEEDALPSLEAAEQALLRALEIYPDYLTARNNLANVVHNRGELLVGQGGDAREVFRHAVELFDQIAAARPGSLLPRFNRGRSLVALAKAMLEQGDDPREMLDEARSALGKVLDIRDDIVDIHLLAIELELIEARWRIAHQVNPRDPLLDARRSLELARRLDPSAGEGSEQWISELESAAEGIQPAGQPSSP